MAHFGPFCESPRRPRGPLHDGLSRRSPTRAAFARRRHAVCVVSGTRWPRSDKGSLCSRRWPSPSRHAASRRGNRLRTRRRASASRATASGTAAPATAIFQIVRRRPVHAPSLRTPGSASRACMTTSRAPRAAALRQMEGARRGSACRRGQAAASNRLISDMYCASSPKGIPVRSVYWAPGRSKPTNDDPERTRRGPWSTNADPERTRRGPWSTNADPERTRRGPWSTNADPERTGRGSLAYERRPKSGQDAARSLRTSIQSGQDAARSLQDAVRCLRTSTQERTRRGP